MILSRWKGFPMTGPSFPSKRMRRMHTDAFSRQLMCENQIRAENLILPVFVLENDSAVEAVPSMPGVERMGLHALFKAAERCLEFRIPAMALFPVIDPSFKSLDGA